MKRLSHSIWTFNEFGRAIHEITSAVKLNYEIYGKTISHLHVHLYPRHRGDPFEGRPINPALIKASPYKGKEFENFVAELRARMGTGGDR